MAKTALEDMDDVQLIIQYIASKIIYTAAFTAKVLSVEDNKTCTVQPPAGNQISGVRLKSALDGGSHDEIRTPAIGSQVTIALLYNKPGLYYVSQYSDIDTIVFRGGQNGGMANTPVLRENLSKTAAYITALETACAALAGVMDGLVPGTLTAFNTAMAAVQQGDFAEIEDLNFKH